jgi:hypothetical protein
MLALDRGDFPSAISNALEPNDWHWDNATKKWESEKAAQLHPYAKLVLAMELVLRALYTGGVGVFLDWVESYGETGIFLSLDSVRECANRIGARRLSEYLERTASLVEGFSKNDAPENLDKHLADLDLRYRDAIGEGAERLHEFVAANASEFTALIAASETDKRKK